MAELSPYHQELLRDAVDWQLFEAGVAAFARISGIDEGKMFDHLNEIATDDQRRQIQRRANRMQEVEQLPPHMRQQLEQRIREAMPGTPDKRVIDVLNAVLVGIFDIVGDEFAPKQAGSTPERRRLLALIPKAGDITRQAAEEIARITKEADNASN